MPRTIDRSRSRTPARPSVLEALPPTSPPCEGKDKDDDMLPLIELKKKRQDKVGDAFSKKKIAKDMTTSSPLDKEEEEDSMHNDQISDLNNNARPSKAKQNKKKTVKKLSPSKAKNRKTIAKNVPPSRDENSSFDSADDQISDHVDNHSSDEDFEGGDDGDSSVSDDAENNNYGAPLSSTKKSPPVKKQSANKTDRSTQQRNKNPLLDSSDEEVIAGPSTRSSRKNSRSRKSAQSEQPPVHTLYAKKKPPPSRRKSKVIGECSSSSSSGSEEFAKRRSPTRASAVKARLLTRERSDSSDEEAFQKSRQSKAKKKIDSDEEAFVLEGEDDGSDDSVLLQDSDAESQDDNFFVKDDDVGDDDSSEDDEFKAGTTVGIVNEGDIGVADDDDDDDTSNHGEPAYASPMLNIRRRPNTAAAAANLFGDDDEDSSLSENDKSPVLSQGMPHCPSTKDVITDEDLPERHICFFPPDGMSRQCFSLETLRQVALSTSNPCFRTDLTGSGKQTFLQPPHFRTVMSDDLLDQIASRFGRDAWDLHGSYYRRKEADKVAGDLWREQPQTAEAALAHSGDFIKQLEQYISRTMGHQDLYCCPLCYIVTYRQMHGKETEDDDFDNASDDERIKDSYVTDFLSDPLSVLGFLDNDAYRIASTFCFKKVSSLKIHLRKDHKVDTKMVQGNEVYARYMIRAQDGLLQRYLNKSSGKWGTTRQGAMLSYWFDGNNFSFLLLLSMVSHASLCRDVVEGAGGRDNEEALDTAKKFLRPAIEFFKSFAHSALDIWDLVASPFKKESKAEIQDFLAEEEEEEEEPIASHRAFRMEAELEEFRKMQDADRQLAAYYEGMEQGRGKDLESYEEDSVSEGGEAGSVRGAKRGSDEQVDDDFEGSEEGVANGGYFEESSEAEEDDWQKKIMSQRVAKQKSLSPRKRSGRRVSLSETKPSPKKRPVWDATATIANDEEDFLSPKASMVRKRMAILDSEDED